MFSKYYNETLFACGYAFLSVSMKMFLKRLTLERLTMEISSTCIYSHFWEKSNYYIMHQIIIVLRKSIWNISQLVNLFA